MKKTIFLTIVLLFAFNAQAAELKIGYVNMNRALNECDQAKEARKTLENMIKTNEALLTKKLDEINKLEEETIKQVSILTPEALREKQFQIKKLKREYRRMKEDSDFETQNKQEELTREIASDLKILVKKIAEKENYSAIFEAAEGSGLLYMPKKLDLTDTVIKMYNETSKTNKSKK